MGMTEGESAGETTFPASSAGNLRLEKQLDDPAIEEGGVTSP